MAYQRFLIAPFKTGLQTNLRPWQIMDDAFTQLQNAYVFRGRVRKRVGSLLMGATQLASRPSIDLGNTPGPVNLPGDASQLAVGQMFSVGNDIFYVWQLGAAATTLSTNPGATATINSTSNPNTVQFTGEPGGTPILYYPANPIMGITQYESGAINDHPSYAFDNQFAYIFSGGSWTRSGTAQWNGLASGTNFFWATNWQGSVTDAASPPVMFVTNFNASLGAGHPVATDDPIWYTPDGSTWIALSGIAVSTNGFFFMPGGAAPYTGPFVQTARIILPFKNRLILLNTVENDNSSTTGTGTATAYVNRCRYSVNGSPLAVEAWYEANQKDSSGNVYRGAGYIDAPTEEQIISAEFIKDRLIVYFERSTWELAYTGNEILPFVFQKINTELGSQSTFSTVPFDTGVVTIGNTGVHTCNGINVDRIDTLIPDEIFEDFETGNSATARVAGIRDYFNEVVYWTFISTSDTSAQNFPNQMLVYNYKNNAWALNDDTFTAFGYFEQGTDITWATSFPITWDQFVGNWQDNVLQANDRQILAGTPEGFIVRLATGIGRNAAAMQITNIVYNGDGTLNLVIINHNFSSTSFDGSDDVEYILLESIVGDATTDQTLNDEIYAVNYKDANTIMIDTNNLPVEPPLITGTYLGGGTGARVSQIQMLSKQFNPFVEQDRGTYIQKVDFCVAATDFGEITVDYYPSSTEVSMIEAGESSGSIMGTSVLETSPYDPIYYPLEQYQDRLWHPIYFQTASECIQFYFYLSHDQMLESEIALEDFQLEGMILYAMSTTARLE